MLQDLPLPLRELEARMSALPAECDVMMLGELDGFLTGVLVCPDLIPPSEWLPLVWGGGDPDIAEGCAFGDTADLNAFCQLVVAHYNQIGADLNRGPGTFAPIYEVDAQSNYVVWELWLSGFTGAMALRPESWKAVALDGDEDAATALATLLALAGIDADGVGLTEEHIEELVPMAPDMIPFCVDKLHAWRVRRDTPQPRPLTIRAKIGRNERCPCESGRKYKTCCGAN
jgi:uncharacterized protein